MTVPASEDRPIVLVLADHYLPGYKAGGPIRTLHNVVQALGDSFEFLIVTRDRDLAATESYDSITIDRWNEVGSAKVFYASPAKLSWRGIGELLRATRHDILYLNSFFSPKMTIVPLLRRRLAIEGQQPVVIAPRGEFAPGALALKPLRKRLYLRLARASGLLDGLNWQATNEVEGSHIRATAQAQSGAITVVPNVLALKDTALAGAVDVAPIARAPGPLRIVFLSRIAPMKNLDFLLRVLKQVKAPLILTVHGPLTDAPYWAQCQDAILALPSNVRFEYVGEVAPERITEAFGAHDLFVFPTRGENFGHVIIEALSAGTALILSDRTPWAPDHDGAVTVLSLDDTAPWVHAVECWTGLDAQALAARRQAALNYAHEYLMDACRASELHKALFLSALKSGPDATRWR